MICSNCQLKSEGGRFCEACGTQLVSNETAATVETLASQSFQANKQIDAAKNISKMYFSFFIDVLKKPYIISKNVGKEQLINSFITIGLYALFIPLMMYFGLKEYTEYIDSPFLNIVVKPMISYAIFIILVGAFTFGALKLGKVNVSFQDVIARFGTTLVPFVGLFLVALVFALLQIKLFVLLLFLGFVGSIFTVPALVIASFKKNMTEGLDAIHGTILTYVATFITIGIMAKVLFSILMEMVQEYISSLFFF